jgi:hypothetical protein
LQAADECSHPARELLPLGRAHARTQTDGNKRHEMRYNNFGAPMKPVFPLAFTANFSIAV